MNSSDTSRSGGERRTPDVSLLKTLIERAESAPNDIYVIDIDDRTLSYGEALGQIAVWAGAYRRFGIAAGEHVVTMQLNTMESMLGWLGLATLRAVEAPINIDYRGALLTHALNLTRARVILVLEQYAERLIPIAKDLEYLQRVIVLDAEAPPQLPFEVTTGSEFLRAVEPIANLERPAPWDIMSILFTSGTTGPSKAVRLPWAQIHAMATGTYLLEDLGPADVIYNPGPTYHVGAKVFPYIAALVGGRHVMRPFISASELSNEYLKYGVTTGGPVLEWLAEPERNDDRDRPLKNILTPYKLTRAEEFAERFDCRRIGCFNMTEVSCPIRFSAWDAAVYDEEGRLSCGVIREGFEGRVVDEHDQPVESGQVGELILRAHVPWTMNAGYLNNPEATAEAWRNGWFHTGDGFICDAAGNYYFIDRLKDCIRRRGENISSFEVEAYAVEHPAIAEAAAVAVKASEEPGANEEIKLIALLAEGKTLDAAELIRWLIPRMPRFMIPRYIEFVDELPRTPTMKVRKKLLRDDALNEQTWDREVAGIDLPR